MELPYAILHCHTISSDGVLTHKEVLDACKAYGAGVVAFTDHDTLLSPEKIAELASLRHDVRFISGIEFSATGTSEVKGSIPSFHVIGLFVNLENEPLRTYCREAKQKRRERLTGIVRNLTAQGFSITAEDIEKQSQEGTIGRPHVVRAVLAHAANLSVIERTLERMKNGAAHDPALAVRYADIEKHTAHQQMFDLFLSEDAFVPQVYVPYLQEVPLDYAVGLIRGAGGIALLAHPSYYREKLGVGLIREIAKAGRIDGIETLYAFTPDESIAARFSADMEAFREINGTYGLVSGGGGDIHTADDFARVFSLKGKALMKESSDFLPRIFAKWPRYKEQLY